MAQGLKTGGRKKGTPNKATSERTKAARAEGLMPLDYMLKVMRDTNETDSRRDDMAKAAAPYFHSKMPVAVHHAGHDGGPLQVNITRFSD